jgi:hypothetical protein
MGIADCDTMLMILGASTDMDKSLQHTATELVMKGFNGKSVFSNSKQARSLNIVVLSRWFLFISYGGIGWNSCYWRSISGNIVIGVYPKKKEEEENQFRHFFFYS